MPVQLPTLKPRLPFNRFWPWKFVVWAMLLMALSDESICNWLAAIWLLLSDEVLAAWVTRPLMVVNSELIWLKALSAVEIIWLATWLLEIAWLVAAILAPRSVAAIMPAGSSAAELIRKPVLKRVKVVCNWLLELAKF